MPRNLIQIREFDKLVSDGSQDSPSPGCTSMEEDAFNQLYDFILRAAERDVDSEDPIEIMRLGMAERQRSIQARNYVGVLTTKNGFTVEILPKIAGLDLETASNERPSSDGLEQTKEAFIRMLAALRGTSFKHLGRSSLFSHRMPLYELFIRMFVEEVERLAQRGLRSGYTPRDSNERFLRGRLLVAQDLRANPIDRSRCFVRHAVFGLNRPENRVIKAALARLLNRSTSSENRTRIRRLLAMFDGVDDTPDWRKAASLCVRDRNLDDYAQALEWARIFLEGSSFTAFSGPTVSEALLFPMERVFEDYVPYLMRRALQNGALDGSAIEIRTQGPVRDLFDKKEGDGAGIRMTPDIVILKREAGGQPKPAVVLDTKWKRLDGSNPQPSRNDLYQMYAYGKRYKVSDVVLVYPKSQGLMAGWQKKFVSDGADGRGLRVRVFMLDLSLHSESSILPGTAPKGGPGNQRGTIGELLEGIRDSLRA
ncbi:MAG: McrC family protein [Coriobacteriia bacterium]|nr:McrC family protein [Coriobacteriia bacterium]